MMKNKSKQNMNNSKKNQDKQSSKQKNNCR